MAYQGLRRAVLNFDYLHTNSTTHEFLFGALAELLDNSRDAQATKIDVFTVDDFSLRGGFLLCFLDDGHGMDMEESYNVFQFGKSYKRSEDSSLIGQYGNGLKSGSMRIGNDFIMFTKRNGEMTCLFLSRTFHAEENIDEVIVPMPSFNAHTEQPLARTAAEKAKHRIEMELILKYSPFKTEEEFFEQFRKINDHGTLVIVYNMKLMDSGLPELDIMTDTTDILLAGTNTLLGDQDDSFVPEKKSFRNYTSILYANPKMKVYIQGIKVRTKKLAALLYKPKVYKYSSNKFKARSEYEAKQALEQAKAADARAREAESKARDLENKYGQGGTKDQRSSLRKAQADAIELRSEAKSLSAVADMKEKACKEPKTLNFVFGINIGNRKMDGCFMYNCSRLIKMYEKVGPQLEGGVQCSGILGYVDVPYIVLEPTHNKQDFADNREYTILKKALGEYMLDYWKTCSGVPSQGVLKFWENFGYISNNWKDAPSDEPKFLRKRLMNLPTMIQCDLCLKWRKLPFSNSNLSNEFPEHWDCEMNPDSAHNRCTQIEEKMNIAVAVYKREQKSEEEKLAAQTEKAKKEFEKLQALRKAAQPVRKAPPPQPPSAFVTLGKRERVAHKPSYSEKILANRSREQRKPSPPPPPKPVGKAKPVMSTRDRTPARPVGKASPVVQKPNNNNSRAFISRGSRSASNSTRAAAQVTKKATPTSRSRAKRKEESSEEEESSSEEESEEEESSSEEEEESEEEPEVKKRKTTTTNSKQNSKKVEKKPVAKKPIAKEKPAAKESDSDVRSSDFETDSEALGQKVEAKIGEVWHTGKVFKVQRRGQSERWRIKFDKNSKDKFDKWYESDSKDIRVANSEDEEEDEEEEKKDVAEQKRTSGRTRNTTTNSTKELEEKSISRTTPSRTTRGSDKKEDEKMDETPVDKSKGKKTDVKETEKTPKKKEEVKKSGKDEEEKMEVAGAESDRVLTDAKKKVFDELGHGYRKCLRYFLPPSWSMDKDQINALSLEDLSAFQLESFFDHYEKGLRDLVGGFQIQAQEKQAEAEESKKKLTRLRKMIAQLLRSINDDINISEDCEGEEIDDLLEECVRQAQQEDT